MILFYMIVKHDSSTLQKKNGGFHTQKKAAQRSSRSNMAGAPPVITPAFWYSPTRFSKKLVLPCREIISILGHDTWLGDHVWWAKDEATKATRSSNTWVHQSTCMPIYICLCTVYIYIVALNIYIYIYLYIYYIILYYMYIIIFICVYIYIDYIIFIYHIICFNNYI